MALAIAPSKETQTFTQSDELLEACLKSEQNTEYVPVEEFNGAYFDDDAILNGHSFTEEGMRSFLSRLNGGPGLFQTLSTIDRPGLASQVVNDLMSQPKAQEVLGKTRFVVDTEFNNVIGAVGSRYEMIPNSQLVEGLIRNDNFDFDKAILADTRLSIKAFDKVHGMEMKSHGLEGKDFIKFGMMTINDMVGRHALSSSICTERMLCTNQMTHPIRKNEFRQIHVGQMLTDRFGEIITLARSEYEVIKDRFEKLSEIEFKPHALAQMGAPIDVLPELQKERLYKPYFNLQGDKRKEAIEKSTEIINSIPNVYGGNITQPIWNSNYRDKKVMFDFCEVFTERSQSDDYTFEQREEIEKNAGELVEWLVKNRKRINDFEQLPVAA